MITAIIIPMNSNIAVNLLFLTSIVSMINVDNYERMKFLNKQLEKEIKKYF